MKKVIYCLLATMLLVSLTLGCAPKPPTEIREATNPAGSLFNIFGVAVGDTIMKHTELKMRIMAMGGESSWIPMLDTGEVDTGVGTDLELWMAYHGKWEYTKRYSKVRAIVVGGPMPVTILVRKDSGINKMADLKGKRGPAGFQAYRVMQYTQGAQLANGGLTYNDIIQVPCTGLDEKDALFKEGRIDFETSSIGDPSVVEMNALIPVKYLSMDPSPEAWARTQSVYPNIPKVLVKAGSLPLITEDTYAEGLRVFFVAQTDLSDDIVYQMTKALWENYQELGAVNPIMMGWTPQAFVSTTVGIPYHNGAIKWFKEKGVWTSELDAMQKKLLAE